MIFPFSAYFLSSCFTKMLRTRGGMRGPREKGPRALPLRPQANAPGATGCCRAPGCQSGLFFPGAHPCKKQRGTAVTSREAAPTKRHHACSVSVRPAPSGCASLHICTLRDRLLPTLLSGDQTQGKSPHAETSERGWGSFGKRLGNCC